MAGKGSFELRIASGESSVEIKAFQSSCGDKLFGLVVYYQGKIEDFQVREVHRRALLLFFVAPGRDLVIYLSMAVCIEVKDTGFNLQLPDVVFFPDQTNQIKADIHIFCI